MMPAQRIAKDLTPFDPCPADAEWRLVPFNGNYAVSEYGHLKRAVGGSNSKPGKVIKPSLSPTGYVKYALNRDGRARHFTAHRLVALAFIGAPPFIDSEVAHGDGIKSHCHHSNLRWATSRENAADRRRHGTDKIGAHHPRAKLSEQDVRQIYRAVGKQRDIAKRYGVSQTIVWGIKSRTIWRSVDVEAA